MPETWRCPYSSLRYLIWTAYDLDYHQYEAPDWAMNTFFSVQAKVPPGTTREQFRKMQQQMLEDRFKLAWHWQPKEATVYDLMVGKNGHKLVESAPDSQEPVVEARSVAGAKLNAEKYPVFPIGVMGLMSMNGRFHWRSSKVTMANLVRVLAWQVRSGVTDQTQLTGKYDVDLYWQERPIEIFPAAPPFDRPIEKVIQETLGLRLQPKKGAFPIFTVDRLNRTPAEN